MVNVGDSASALPPVTGSPRRRTTVWLNLLFVAAIVVPLVLSAVWIVTAARTVESSTTELTFSQHALADTRLYDEVLTMSATMAAQTGDQKWIDRYDKANADLKASLASAQRSASDAQLPSVLDTISANDALLAMEGQSLAAAQTGDLARARKILASDEYIRLKAEYADSIDTSSQALEADVNGQVRLWRWLLGVQLVVTVAAVILIAWLARSVARRARRNEYRLRQSLDFSVIGTALVSADHTISYANPALCTLLGYSLDELIGRSFLDFTHPDDRATTYADWAALDRGLKETFARRKRFVTASGDIVWVDAAAAVVRGRDRRVRYYVEQTIDATGEVRSHEALEHASEQFRMLAENATDIVYQTASDGTITWISPSVRTVLGWEPDDLVGTKSIDLVDPRDRSMVTATRQSLYRDGDEIEVRVRYRTTGGGSRTMIATARPVTEHGGVVAGAVVGLRDITEEEAVRRNLEASERQFRVAVEGAPSGVALAGRDGVFIAANPALCDLLRTSPDDVIGTTLAEWVTPEDVHDGEVEMEALLAGEKTRFEHEHRLCGVHVEPWVRHSVSLVRDAEGEPYLFIHQFADESIAHNLQAELAYRASHDVLTGLSNRSAIMETLHSLTGHRREHGDNVGVLFCDVDRLKPINDSHGHLAGDAVLTAVAHRMSSAVRASDIVARIGGDEFVVVLPEVRDSDEVLFIAEKIRAAVSGPVTVGDVTIDVTVSIGATIARPDDEPDAVLGRADQALYAAKEQGRDRACIG